MKKIILASVMCLAFAGTSQAQTNTPASDSVSNDKSVDSTLSLLPTPKESEELRGEHNGGRPGPMPGPSHGAPHGDPHNGGGEHHPGNPSHGNPPGNPSHGNPPNNPPHGNPPHGNPPGHNPPPNHNPPLPPNHGDHGHDHGHAPIGHHPGPGWHDGGPRPGYHSGWHHDHNWHPHWWYHGIVLPIFVWAPEAPRGFWQCTAFSEDRQVFSASAPDQEEAIYNALYDCGGPDYQEYGCYVPEGYCQFRR